MRLFYPEREVLYSAKMNQHILAAEEILIRHHVPFGYLIATPDGVPAIPSETEVLVLPGLVALSDAQVAGIDDQMETLSSSDRTFKFTETNGAVSVVFNRGDGVTVKLETVADGWESVTLKPDLATRTLEVALSAIVLGLAIGFLVAVIRSTHDKYGKFAVLNALAKVYLTVIRGTPMVVQLLITYYIILRSVDSKVLIAILAFGINSGAYQAEIIRAGITSIDAGQMEAGRALGLSYWRTMLRIILPQAIRNVLPALGNEFIVLMKDTSIVGYIALIDLAKGGDIIRSQTYSVYLPYLTVAAIYLVLVMTFTWLLGKLERHLRNTGAEVVRNDS